MSDKPRKEERRTRILEELRLFPHVRISNLAEKFDVTTETIRRDLDALSAEGLVDRAYGGASARPMGFQPPVGQRRQEFVLERERIGVAAASLISPGEVVMIDAGATTAHLGRQLVHENQNITIITNSYPVAWDAGSNNIRVVVCPGDFNAGEGGVYGGDTVDFLARFHANKAFIGSSGLSVDGFSDVNREAAWIKRTMMQRAEETWLLADHGKFNVQLLEIVAPLAALTGVITDRAPTGGLKVALDRAGITVHVAADTTTMNHAIAPAD